MKLDSCLMLGLAAFGVALHAGPTAAQQSSAAAGYPSKPIRVIVPLAPGGPSDILARTLAQKLGEGIRQTVIVDNRPGATGTIGTEITAIDFLAGHTQIYLSNLLASLPQIRSGKIRPLATSRATRAKVLPEIPTIAESAVPGFDEGGQHGVVVPSATPREIIARLHDEIVKAMNAPEVRKRLEAEGSEVVGSTPEQYGAIIRRDIEKWAKVIKETGARIE